uniref:Secreted protein n=1 Tax=Heterorhabditis bacteriophora TaxID=37862 RepID=A0A1I7XA23_HETBA
MNIYIHIYIYIYIYIYKPSLASLFWDFTPVHVWNAVGCHIESIFCHMSQFDQEMDSFGCTKEDHSKMSSNC